MNSLNHSFDLVELLKTTKRFHEQCVAMKNDEFTKKAILICNIIMFFPNERYFVAGIQRATRISREMCSLCCFVESPYFLVECTQLVMMPREH